MNITSMKNFIVLIVSAFVIFGASASVAQIDRSKKPEPGPLPKSISSSFNEIKLKNGLRIVVVEDHKQPLVYFRALVLSGNAQDGNTIGAAAAVSSLLEKGTKTMSADDIAKKLDFYGATIGTGSTVDDINITVGCLKRDLDKVLPVYADVMKNPLFASDEIEKYKTEQLSNLKSARQSPAELGRKMGRKLLYDAHPYGYFQTETSIKALSSEVLKNWHKDHFSAENTIIAVVGDITEKEIKPLIEKYFGDWQKGAYHQPSYIPLAESQGMSITLVDRPGSAQSSIRLQRLGLPVTSPDFDRASLVASIFAGNGVIGFQNRLFQNIREKHGYTYTPGGSLTKSIDRGVLVAVAEVRNSVTDSALDQMLLEYRRLSQEKITDQELTFAKGLIAGKFMMDLADPQNTSALTLSTIEYGLPKDYYATYPDRISKFTAAELQEVASRVYPPNDLHVIVIGDASQVLPKLQRFGKVTVYDLDFNLVKDVKKAMAPTKMSLDQVLEKMYSGLNKSAMEQLKSRATNGSVTLELAGKPAKGTIEVLEAPAHKKYQKVDLGGPYQIETRIDGTNVYMSYPGGAGPADPETAKEELSNSVFNQELHLKDPGYDVKLLGVSAVPAGVAYAIEVNKPTGTKENWYIDTVTGYVTRREHFGANGVSSEDFSNFKVIDGIPYAFSVVTRGGGDNILEINSIKHNVTVDEKLFAPKQ